MKNKLTILAVSLVAILIIVLVFGKLKTVKQAEVVLPKFDPKSVVVAAAPQGEAIALFPAGLIVDEKATILGSSEDVAKDPSFRTFSTVFSTKLGISEIKKRYLNFSTKNSFEVKGDTKAEEEFGGIFGVAKDFSKSFMVTFSQNSTKEEILVSVIFSQKK